MSVRACGSVSPTFKSMWENVPERFCWEFCLVLTFLLRSDANGWCSCCVFCFFFYFLRRLWATMWLHVVDESFPTTSNLNFSCFPMWFSTHVKALYPLFPVFFYLFPVKLLLLILLRQWLCLVTLVIYLTFNQFTHVFHVTSTSLLISLTGWTWGVKSMIPAALWICW